MTTPPSAPTTMPRRPLPQMRRVTVTAVQRLTPRMVRITIAGEELEGFKREGGAGHVRVWIPNADGELVYPGSPPEWQELPAERRSPTRVYTPRRWDPERREMDLDFVLHGDGPLSTWAAQAQVGDRLVVAGPGREYTPSPDASWYLIAGDESAVPAIGTLLELISPDIPTTVLIEVKDTNDEQPIPTPQGASIRWLHRAQGDLPGDALLRAIRETPLPKDPMGRVWVACEAMAVRAIRRHLLLDRGFAPAAVHTRGYWKYGSANHPDHDMGED